jgi:hypothetical protein
MSPTYPNAVLQDATKQRMTRIKVGETAVISVGNKGRNAQLGSLNEQVQLRATMEPTADDIEKNRHVNSWTHL